MTVRKQRATARAKAPTKRQRPTAQANASDEGEGADEGANDGAELATEIAASSTTGWRRFSFLGSGAHKHTRPYSGHDVDIRSGAAYGGGGGANIEYPNLWPPPFAS